MATLSDLTWDTLELLYGIPQFERSLEDTVVQWPATSAATEMEFGSPELWKRGDTAELILIERTDPATGVEMVRLEEDHPAAGSTVTIRRKVAYDDQPGLAITSGFVRKNPLFPIHGTYAAVQQVLDSELWPHVWTTQTRKLNAVTVAVDKLYDLQAGDEDVVRVYQYNLNATGEIKEFPYGWWDYEPSPHADLSTVPSLILRKVHDDNEPVYVVTRNRPSTSGVADVSTQIETMVPYMAASKMMLARVSGVDYDPARQERDQYNKRSYARDHYQTFAAEFLRLRDAENKRLLDEQPKAPKKYRGHPLRVRRLTG